VARTIPHRELRNDSSAVLRAVRDGETIEVTNNGEVVAILVPPPRAPGAHLPIRRATVSGGFAGIRRIVLDRPLQGELDDLRGDR
jgi:prevent-host-death family protein